MQIILRGPAAGYEAEHTARIFFPGAEKAEDLPETEDFVLAESHEMTDLILVRKDGRLYWRTDLRSPEADPEYALCKLEFGLLKDLTGIDPPWGMMTGVRPVRIIHDLRAAGESEEAIAEKFLDHFACTPEKFKLALGIADLQRPVLDAADPWIAASMRASRSAPPGAAIAALFPARWGTKPPARWCSPTWTSCAGS